MTRRSHPRRLTDAQRAMLRDFRGWCANERRYRAATQDAYVGVVRRADVFLRRAKVCPGIHRAQPEDLRTFVWQLPDTAASRALATKALRAFGDFCVATGRRKVNPANALTVPRQPRRVPKALGTDQLAAVLSVARLQAQYKETLIYVLAFTGVRVGEAVRLRWVDIEGDWLRIVEGKGGHERVVPLHPRGRAALKRLQAAGAASEWVFPRPSDPRLFIPPESAYRIVRSVGEDAGIDGVHPHLLRSTFATLLLEGSADVRLVQEALGHRSLTSTQVYCSVRPERLAAAVGRLRIGSVTHG